jgi:SAM-dependent methyltransferase
MKYKAEVREAMSSGGVCQMPADGARADLLRLINGFQTSQAIHVAATLGLADLLGSGPKTTADLAVATKTHPAALYRLMRALASIGVFQEGNNRRFALTPVGEFLRTDVVGTHAPMAQLVGRPNYWQAWGALLYAVQTGTIAFDHVHGSGVWEYRAQRPEEARIFDRAMASGTERFAEAVLEVCDFGRFHSVIDVGGGDGMFLAKILAAYPGLRGTVFDQPHVTAEAAISLEALGLSGRCQAIAGDFLVGVPEGGDVYLLKWILHDWDDAAAIGILRSCRRAMKPSGRLLVVEHVIGLPNASPDGKFMDLAMMTVTGGRERTEDEFATLLAEAGFQLISVTPTATLLSLIEGALKGA